MESFKFFNSCYPCIYWYINLKLVENFQELVITLLVGFLMASLQTKMGTKSSRLTADHWTVIAMKKE